MALTPDNLSKRYYEKLGYAVIKTEHYNIATGHKHDYLGFLDYHMINDEEIIGVQTTSWGNHGARRKKIYLDRASSFKTWLGRGGNGRSVILQSWKKKNGKWISQEEELTMEGMAEFVAKHNEKEKKKRAGKPSYFDNLLSEAQASSGQ